MKTETVVARESQHTSLERARDFRCWLLEINGPLTNLTNEQFRLYEETFPKSKEIAWAFKDDSHQALVEALQTIFTTKALYAWVSEKGIGDAEWKRRSAIIQQAEQALRLAQGGQ